jgi:hypothetical protein
VQDQDIIPRLGQVRGYQVPAKSTGAGDDKRLRGRISGLEELPQHGEGFPKSGDEGRTNVALAITQYVSLMSNRGGTREDCELDEHETHLKWLMDWRTASSSSIGPGMSRVGCSAWEDMFGDGVVLNRLAAGAGEAMLRVRSIEKGVLSGRGGLRSRCLEIKESLSCGATMEIAGYNR